jgi:hypothetical protein
VRPALQKLQPGADAPPDAMTKAQKINPDPARTPASRDRAQPTPEKPTREQREKILIRTTIQAANANWRYGVSNPACTTCTMLLRTA